MAWLLARKDVYLVLAGPSKVHAFAKDMADFNVRCQMTQDLLAHFSMPASVQVSRIEQDLAKENAPVCTYDVLVALRVLYPEHSIVFGLGPDNVEQFHRFYRYKDILAEFELEECPTMGMVRSTDIRNAAKAANAQFIAQHTAPTLVERVLQLYK